MLTFKYLKNDFSAGLVVFLVAVPLCLGIALASGAPFFSGMISGIIGGIVVGLLSHSNLSITGPAAGLTAVVLSSLSILGDFKIFLLSVVLAGAIQLVLGYLKAGTLAEYLPSNVIKGMLTGIGIIIILKQIPHAFGYDKEPEGQLSFLLSDGSNTISTLSNIWQNFNLGAIIISFISMAVIVLWDKPFIKKRVGLIPGPLIAVLVGILLNEAVFSHWNGLQLSTEHLVQVPVVASFYEFFQQLTFPDWTAWNNLEVYTVALTLAAVASVETLLCIDAVDRLDPEKRVTSGNAELKAQGIGNILCGLLGGLPVTSVIVRSSANVQANAKTKLSAIIHGFLLLVCVAFIPNLLNKIPLAALAAILIYVGYKLCSPSVFKGMFKNGKYQWVPFVVTVTTIVFTDLLTGVGIGLATSVLAILRGNYKNSYYYHEEKHKVGSPIVMRLSEEVSFLNKASIRQTLDHLPPNTKLTIDASNTQYIDFDVLEIIKEFKTVKAPLKNIDCQLKGFKEAYFMSNDQNVISVDIPTANTDNTNKSM